jgi:hypothetical protein
VARAEAVAAVRLDQPFLVILVPGQSGRPGLEEGVAVEVKAPGDGDGVLPYLLARCVAPLWDVADFLEQRHITRCPSGYRVSVPVPGEQTTKSCTDDNRLDIASHPAVPEWLMDH